MLRLLAVVCPPLAVIAAGRPALAGLNAALSLTFYVPGLLHALAVVDRHETDRRNDTILRLDAMLGA